VIEARLLGAAVRRGEASAVDAVGAALRRADSVQGGLNICTLVDEAALGRAADIDRRVAGGDDPGPLAGVPVAVKDIIDHRGRATTCGSAFYRVVADRSATVVDRLEAAGAVVVARVGLHEFAYGFSSENDWFGPVRNPLDPTLSPGGSSGGSGAAVAAGIAPLALGTDTGGSVRVPAALCGVFGLKPTHGAVPLTGVFPLAASLDTVGPLAASVADLALAISVLAGFDPADPWSRPRPPIGAPSRRHDLRGLRVGVPVPWLDRVPVTDDVADAFAAVTVRLAEAGAEIVEVVDDDLAPPGMIFETSATEVAAVHRRWLAEGRPYGPEVADRLAAAVALDVDDAVAGRAWQARLRQRFEVAFSACDVLVTPATGAARKVIGVPEIATGSGPRPYREVLSGFTALVNSAGCPALVGPLAGTGVPPVGLQVVGPWWSETRLLEVAAVLEETGILGLPAPPAGLRAELG